MVGTDRAETVTASKSTTITPAVEKKILTFEATVSTDDTITLNDLTTINGTAVLKKSDGAAVTCTVATNVITITGAGLTDIAVAGIAIGT
jgi:hypothetical protein